MGGGTLLSAPNVPRARYGECLTRAPERRVPMNRETAKTNADTRSRRKCGRQDHRHQQSAPRRCVRRAASDRETLEDVLRSRGHRVSAARRLVLMSLFAADRPVTAEQIAAGVDGLPPCDIASIYRNLEMLEQQGLVYHLHLGHGPRYYRLSGPNESCYLVCERCERVAEITASGLDGARAALLEQTGFQASFTHFAIAGACAACSADRW